MALFPPSTNSDYRGATISAWFLMLVAMLEFVPGCIHFFLPDGGAGVIAMTNEAVTSWRAADLEAIRSSLGIPVSAASIGAIGIIMSAMTWRISSPSSTAAPKSWRKLIGRHWDCVNF